MIKSNRYELFVEMIMLDRKMNFVKIKYKR